VRASAATSPASDPERRAQHLSPPLCVSGDELLAGVDDRPQRSVVRRQHDRLGSGVVLLEADQAGRIAAAKRVQRLIVVADPGHVAALASRQKAREAPL
jgi:hypothetical protein